MNRDVTVTSDRRDLLIDAISGRGAAEVGSTMVHLRGPLRNEVEAYVATGEPLRVAGAFTIDGLGTRYVDGPEGERVGLAEEVGGLDETAVQERDFGLPGERVGRERQPACLFGLPLECGSGPSWPGRARGAGRKPW